MPSVQVTVEVSERVLRSGPVVAGVVQAAASPVRPMKMNVWNVIDCSVICVSPELHLDTNTGATHKQAGARFFCRRTALRPASPKHFSNRIVSAECLVDWNPERSTTAACRSVPPSCRWDGIRLQSSTPCQRPKIVANDQAMDRGMPYKMLLQVVRSCFCGRPSSESNCTKYGLCPRGR